LFLKKKKKKGYPCCYLSIKYWMLSTLMKWGFLRKWKWPIIPYIYFHISFHIYFYIHFYIHFHIHFHNQPSNSNNCFASSLTIIKSGYNFYWFLSCFLAINVYMHHESQIIQLHLNPGMILIIPSGRYYLFVRVTSTLWLNLIIVFVFPLLIQAHLNFKGKYDGPGQILKKKYYINDGFFLFFFIFFKFFFSKLIRFG